MTRFCLALEELRRTDGGRVRTAREMLDFFFPRDPAGAPTDRIFVHLPNEVRGPILSGWGIRGAKSALRDTDEKVRTTVGDALAAGDIDEVAFEAGLEPGTVIDWVPLPEWWDFWRKGRLTGVAIQKALAAARDLALFDDRWFLSNVEGRGGKVRGTVAICETLSKDQIVGWVRKIHEAGDGSPSGLVRALGWDTILAKTSQEVLLFTLDALARKVGLTRDTPDTRDTPASPGPAGTDAAPTAATLEDDSVAVPDIPILEAPLAVDGAADGADASSNHASPASDPPPSFQEIPDDETPRQPPPIPAARRRT